MNPQVIAPTPVASTADVDQTRTELALALRALDRASGAPAVLIAPMNAFCIVRVEGADARTFLHGQVSADVLALDELRATQASYCTAKGRMLANFVVIRDADALRLVVRSNLAQAFVKRLSMFVLRSKVKVTLEAANTALVGLIGARRAQALDAVGVVGVPAPYHGARSNAGALWIGLPGERALGLIGREELPAAIASLSNRTVPVGEACWDWIDIGQGIVYIDSATQDQLTPHMANLELIGGVSFQKGCYPGQEIVARTQHLGKVKRRVYRAHVAGDQAPRAGEALFSAAQGDQAVGIVLNSVPAPDGGFDLLASLLSSAVHSADVALGTVQGPTLAFRELPYPLPD